MNLSICENPIRVFSKTLHRFIYVKCGKCNTCRNIRNNTWVDRLVQESQCWKYSVFFTLTFDDKHLPVLSLDSDGHTLVDVNDGFSVDLNDLPNYASCCPVKQRLYVHKRKFIPYVTSDIVQKFLKRLRYYMFTLLKNTNEKKTLRYFIVSEYGPSTYRPHIHGILFFGSDTFASRYEEMLCKAWSFGDVNSSFVRDSCASYVARYVDCNYALPRVYLHRQIRPFLLCSKQPPIGTLLCTKKELSQIFHKGIVRRTIHDYKRNKFKDVPLWRSLKDRLFPKIQSFDTFSHSQRVTLYGCYRYFQGYTLGHHIEYACDSTFPDDYDFDCFREFLGFVYWIIHQSDDYGVSNNTFLCSYLRFLFDQDSLSSRPGSFYCLRNFFYISKRVVTQCESFGCSLDYYVDRIENFYSVNALDELKRFYEFQNDFVCKHRDSRLLLFMYPDLVRHFDELFSSAVPELFTYDLNVLGCFGFDLTSLDYQYIDVAFDSNCHLKKVYCFCRDQFLKYDSVSVRFNAKIFKDSLKNKKKNDYLHWIENNEAYNKTFGFDFFKDYA